MQGLMLKLLNVDAAGERALRVVAYFDELLAHRPDIDAVVRATAILADCDAGLRIPGDAVPVVFTAEGAVPASGADDTTTASIDIDVDDAGGRSARAWLMRTGGAGDLDAFILERMAIVVAAVLERRRHARSTDAPIGFADPALAALLVNERASETDRVRAARLLGVAVPGALRCIALSSTPAQPVDFDELRRALSSSTRRAAFTAPMASDVVLCLVSGGDVIEALRSVVRSRAAVGPLVDVLESPASWAAARRALRFAGLGAAWPRVVRSEQIGALDLLLGLDPQQVAADADVRAVARLHEQPGGEESVQILDHLLHAESLRSAARDANFHHSSLQARLKRIEGVLGMDLRESLGRQRAMHALLLWQLFVEDRHE